MNLREAVDFVVEQLDIKLKSSDTENELFSEWDLVYLVRGAFKDLQYALLEIEDEEDQ